MKNYAGSVFQDGGYCTCRIIQPVFRQIFRCFHYCIRGDMIDIVYKRADLCLIQIHFPVVRIVPGVILLHKIQGMGSCCGK